MDKIKLIEQINKKASSTLLEALGIVVTNIEKDSVSGKMPVNQKTKQPFGLLHGGASVALAETLGSIGAGMKIDQETQSVVGIEINASHLKTISSGWVFGEANIVRIGKKIQVWEIEIKNKDKQLICKSRLTLATINKK